ATTGAPAEPTTAAPLPAIAAPVPTSASPIAEEDIPRVVRAALADRLPPTDLEGKALAFAKSLYAQPLKRLNQEALMTVVDGLIERAALQSGPPILIPRPLKGVNFLPYHAVDTALWTSWLGVILGLSRDELAGLLMATLLRDIGQLYCPPELVGSKAPLSAQQKSGLQDHPLKTVSWLARNGVEHENVHRTVRQHHERFDGKGYPLRLPGRILTPPAQVLAIADTLVAIASDRPHRPARTLHDAMQAVVEGSGTSFSPDLAKLVVQQAGLYPAGSVLALENGTCAVVLDGAGLRRFRPLVRTIGKINGTVELGDELDLAKKATGIRSVIR
ncbi:MAG TPA: HD domain-containing phosphohydrolase, partial [bacterium]|nr:HD domain-containing phosphohydrolase [bacterium]